MKRYLPFVIVGAVALITVGSGVALYRAKRTPPPAPKKNSMATVAEGNQGLHARGNAKATVTLEEFGDFQCPPCATMAGMLKGIEEKYGARLRLLFHHFPLAIHVHAREAALASEAAYLQGRFWEMHDLLYQEQLIWTKAPDVPALFNSYAARIGLDVERFKKDMQSPEAKGRVAADQKRGTARGVTSTPTIFINDVVVPATSLNPTDLHAAIDAALKEKTAP
ncbi:MAG: DsbA family protein [Verrucomicrobiaceae bacterium]|nr:DsbA family protein [Verrucomicrobiaceae bacterium]